MRIVVQGQLKSANVGDSGFVVLGRSGYGSALGVKYHSPQQEHSFGCPYQLGHYEGADVPEDAMLMTLPVRVCARMLRILEFQERACMRVLPLDWHAPKTRQCWHIGCQGLHAGGV